jgi:hypothetical protein
MIAIQVNMDTNYEDDEFAYKKVINWLDECE